MTKTRVVVLLGVIVVALGWVAAQALSSNLVYYQTPTELLAKGDPAVGERVRLGGLVARGSIEQLSGGRVRFILTDGTSRMTVIDTGDVPLLFKDDKGVVVEGAMTTDGTFHADTVLVQHGDSYRPPAPGETPTAYDPDA